MLVWKYPKVNSRNIPLHPEDNWRGQIHSEYEKMELEIRAERGPRFLFSPREETERWRKRRSRIISFSSSKGPTGLDSLIRLSRDTEGES